MKRKFEQVLESVMGHSLTVDRVQAVGGGSINKCYQVASDRGSFFVKENSRSQHPGMFEAEMKGLQLLEQHTLFRIPKTYGIAEIDDLSFLVMEYLSPAAPCADFWEVFGRQLANMHKVTNKQFGLDHPNYIGSLPQHNTQTGHWNAFFIGQRMKPQLQHAVDQHLLHASDVRAFERLFQRLDEFFQPEPPSLLHGDLWSGNFVRDDHGKPALIDPAVYYGHRLMDIGMTRLFGGFDQRMYEVYDTHYPLPPNWEDTADICNLYPLLVHVNLFGRSYVSQVRNILKRYA